MRKSIFVVLLVLSLAVPAFAVDGVLSGVISSDEASDKAIYGSYIVWKANDGTIKLYSFNNSQTNVIGYGRYPRIYRDIVVWIDTASKNVVKYDIKTGTVITIGSELYATVGRPWIHGPKVVWNNSYTTIYLYDLITGQTTTLPVQGNNPVIYENMVTYLNGSEVHLYDLARGTDTIVGTENSMFRTALIDDKYVYWFGYDGSDNTINRYDISANISLPSVSVCGSPFMMAVSGGKVYFDGNCGGPEYWRVREFNPKTGSMSVLTAPVGSQPWAPAVYSNKVVWSHWPDGLRTFDITSPGEEIYSLNSSGNTVAVINPYDKRKVTDIITGGLNAGPSDAALSPEESYYYVFNSSEKSVAIIKTIDATDYNVVGTVLLNPLASQSITGITGDDNGNAYVTVKRTGQPGEVWKVNQSGRSLLQALTGNSPSGIKISKEKDGQGSDLYKLFVSDSQNGNVTVINLTDSSNSGVTTNAGSKIVRP